MPDLRGSSLKCLMVLLLALTLQGVALLGDSSGSSPHLTGFSSRRLTDCGFSASCGNF